MIERQVNPFLGPQSLGQQPLQVEVVNPESVSVMTEDGGMIIDFDPNKPLTGGDRHDSNLVNFIEEDELTMLAAELVRDYEADKLSRKDWEDAYLKGLDLLGLKFEERSEPWDGACGVFHPLLAESVVRFQAQTIQEIFPASGPAKATVVGEATNDRMRQAGRVEDYLNYLATNTMTEYRSETEKLLFSLPLAGSAFRKVYYDPNLGRECSMFVPAEDFVVSYGASDLSTCERSTHVMKRSGNWVHKMQVSGFYRDDVDLPEPSPDLSEVQSKKDELTGHARHIDTDKRHTMLEMQVDLDLPGFEDRNGVALPYVVTIDKSSRTIMSIYRNWREDDQARLRRDHYVQYTYLPGLGFYGFGLVHIIGGLSQSATSLLRQLVDSGTLANLPGGLKTRGLRIKGDDTPIAPGEFRDVDVPGGAIKDNISFLPYKEPSTVLYQLLGDIVKEGRHFASAADLKAADMNAEAPVGTTLALLEREMKVLSAVQARVHEAMGKELKLLAELVKDYGPQEYPYDVGGEFTVAQDFDERIDVIPVSDPNAGTMAQRIMQYQAALQLSSTAPQIYDMPRLHRQMIEVLGVQEAEKIIPTENDMVPTDPVSENMNILNGEPVKAFLYQDHEAHIQVHMSAVQNPQLMALLEKNPKAPAMQAAMMDHITEHVAMAYRQRIEKELGTPLPPPDQPLPEDIELRLSRLTAPAAAQLTGKAQKQAQAEENAKKQQDPIIQLQQAKQKLEEQKQRDRKDTEDKRLEADWEKHQDKIEVEQERIEQNAVAEENRITAQLISKQIDAEIEDERLTSQEMQEGYRLGLELARQIIERREVKEMPDGKQ